MKRNLLAVMILAVATITVGCSSTEPQSENNKLIECEFSKNQSASQIKAIFESATLLPLEQNESSLVSSACDLLEANGDYYLINKHERSCHRFDKDGKFKNIIGQSGRAGDEYLNITSIQILDDEIMIYSTAEKKIYKYNADGKFLASVDTGINAQQLLKVDDKYYGYFGFCNGQQEERVLLFDDSFERIGDYLPSEAKIIVFAEDVPSLTLCGDEVYIRETYSNIIHTISKNGELSELIEFDFGSYNIPASCFTQSDAFAAAEIMISSDFASILRFEQHSANSLVNVIYQLSKGEQMYNMIGVDRKDGNYKWITATSEGSNAILFSSVRHIADDGRVVALVERDIVEDFIKQNPNFIDNTNLLKSIDGDNPVIIKFKLK